LIIKLPIFYMSELNLKVATKASGEITPVIPNKEGILFKKSKSFWKSGWKEKQFILNGSSLYYYEKAKKEAAQGVIQLQHIKLVTETYEKRKFVMCLVQGNNKSTLIAAKNDIEFGEWLKAIQDSVNLPPTPPPERNLKPRRSKVTAQLVETATNFGVVRKMIKEYVPADTFQIVSSIKKFVTTVDSAEQAQQLEIIVMQLGAKIGLLYKDKKITRDYLIPAIEPLHIVCDKLIDGYEIPFAFDPKEISKAMNDLLIVLEQMFKPLLPEKAMKDLSNLIGYMANEELLTEFFTKKSTKKPRTFARLCENCGKMVWCSAKICFFW